MEKLNVETWERRKMGGRIWERERDEKVNIVNRILTKRVKEREEKKDIYAEAKWEWRMRMW